MFLEKSQNTVTTLRLPFSADPLWTGGWVKSDVTSREEWKDRKHIKREANLYENFSRVFGPPSKQTVIPEFSSERKKKSSAPQNHPTQNLCGTQFAAYLTDDSLVQSGQGGGDGDSTHEIHS